MDGASYTLPTPLVPDGSRANVHIDVAPVLGHVRELVRASDQLGRDRVRLLGGEVVEDRLHAQHRGLAQRRRRARGPWARANVTGDPGAAHERDADAWASPARTTISAGPSPLVPTPSSSPARAIAAATNSRNSGAGRSGRDLNSG